MVLELRECPKRFVSGLLAVAFVAGCGAGPSSIGASVPTLVLADSRGVAHGFPSQLAPANLTVFWFFSAECPCSRAHEGRLRELASAYESRGIRIFWVDSEASASPARDAALATERGLPPLLIDPRAELANALGAEYAAFAVVVDKRGRVRYAGGVDSDKSVLHDSAEPFLRDALDALLAGQKPPSAVRKSLGCALMKR
jgi:hypothetical protein